MPMLRPGNFIFRAPCRSRYHFNQAFFSLHGNVVLADFRHPRSLPSA